MIFSIKFADEGAGTDWPSDVFHIAGGKGNKVSSKTEAAKAIPLDDNFEDFNG